MQIWQTIAIAVGLILVVGAGWWIYQRNRSEARIRKQEILPLSLQDRTRFLEKWRLCQARFVNDPAAAVHDADQLINDIMRVRGVTDVTSAYPAVSPFYREATDLLTRHRQTHASTHQLRRAFINFRSVFDQMLTNPGEELKRAA
jgi:hypothetical protein